jgi:hypothetical protein
MTGTLELFAWGLLKVPYFLNPDFAFNPDIVFKMRKKT